MYATVTAIVLFGHCIDPTGEPGVLLELTRPYVRVGGEVGIQETVPVGLIDRVVAIGYDVTMLDEYNAATDGFDKLQNPKIFLTNAVIAGLCSGNTRPGFPFWTRGPGRVGTESQLRPDTPGVYLIRPQWQRRGEIVDGRPQWELLTGPPVVLTVRPAAVAKK